MRILLDDHAKWHRSDFKGEVLSGTVYGRGFAFVNGKYFREQALINFVAGQCAAGCEQESVNRIRQLVTQLNGSWAIIVQFTPTRVLLVVDRYRSIPLFYTCTPVGIAASSSPDNIISVLGLSGLDELSALEFVLCGFVTGADTVFQDIKQVQPGELVELRNGPEGPNAQPNFYFRFMPMTMSDQSESELEEEFLELLTTIFVQVAGALQNRKVVIPLSGGLDSRLIAAMFSRIGFDNVVCYTYGSAGNGEVQISQRVAEFLKYDWYSVEYSGQMWNSWVGSPGMCEYWKYACRGTSLPIFQDLPAITSLKQQLRGDDSWIVVPGNIGDFCSGGHTPPAIQQREAWDDPLTGSIFEDHYELWPVPRSVRQAHPFDSLRAKIQEQTFAIDIDAEEERKVWAYVEWEFRGRLAMFIANSARAYEYAGIDWMHPMGDYAFTDFFRKVPIKYRVLKRLFINTLRDGVCTGPLAGLREIPRFGGPWSERITDATKSDWKIPGPKGLGRLGWLSGSFKTSQIFYILNFLRRRFRSDKEYAFDWWFTHGRRPEDVTVKEALVPYNPYEILPKSLLSIIRPFEKRPVYAAGVNSLLTFAVLALEIQRARATNNLMQ